MSELIALVAHARDGEHFTVKDTRPIHGSYAGEGRPFILFSESIDAGTADAIAALTGWYPAQGIGFAAMCNGDEDHRILAELALWLAGRLSGYVDMGGEPDLPAGLPGNAHALPYDTASGWEAHATLLDPTALAAWMRCQAFRMVK
ncbi:hypothetical protein F0185_08710 [Massilia sp. CCM 8692]|uniref:Uncharacterized protein n=1 Tax=Massilia rubra TaxID=2607910 RepID=A0ABX0LI20_9BURK|nr:hypothetical protein [Massilia rubra]